MAGDLYTEPLSFFCGSDEAIARRSTQMSNSIVFDRAVELVRDRLGLNSVNQKIISSNLANINTPGYVSKELSFEQALRESLDSQSMRLVTSDRQHIDPSDLHAAMESPEVVETGPVDLDQEMMRLSKNSIEYNLMVTMLNKKFSGLKETIREA